MMPFIICIISTISTTTTITEIATATDLSIAENISSSISTMLPLSQNKQQEGTSVRQTNRL